MSTGASTRKSMRPFGELAPFQDAREQALALVQPIRASRELSLKEAADRVLSVDVNSPVDVPAVDRAAMDGYAVRASDIATGGPDSPVMLRCEARLLAGTQPTASVEPGTCVEIATGAPMPPGADAVVPVEETKQQGDQVAILICSSSGSHVSERGEDLKRGERLARAGDRLTPAIVAALASVGTETVSVWQRPRVLLVPTGDELVALGEPLPSGHVYDSNSVALEALLEENGAAVERTGILRDDSAALVAELDRPEFDLVITLGGTSVGRHDLVIDVVANLGEVLIHGVAVKPGKPLMLARVGDRPIVGLPGFPTSCLMLGYAVVEPMVRRMSRQQGTKREHRPAKLVEEVHSPAGKHQLLTVVLEGNEAIPAYRASSTITSMSLASGWFEIDADVEKVPAGTKVEVILF